MGAGGQTLVSVCAGRVERRAGAGGAIVDSARLGRRERACAEHKLSVRSHQISRTEDRLLDAATGSGPTSARTVSTAQSTGRLCS